MKTYRFDTITTMKEYNDNKYWITSDIIQPLIVESENLKQALESYRKYTEETAGITISNNAMKNKSAMYNDCSDGSTVQTGYVITGKTEIYDDDKRTWTSQYIDLWVKITEVITPNFMEA